LVNKRLKARRYIGSNYWAVTFRFYAVYTRSLVWHTMKTGAHFNQLGKVHIT